MEWYPRMRRSAVAKGLDRDRATPPITARRKVVAETKATAPASTNEIRLEPASPAPREGILTKCARSRPCGPSERAFRRDGPLAAAQLGPLSVWRRQAKERILSSQPLQRRRSVFSQSSVGPKT